MKPLRISLVALAGLIAAPANAQDDWDLGRDPGALVSHPANLP